MLRDARCPCAWHTVATGGSGPRTACGPCWPGRPPRAPTASSSTSSPPRAGPPAASPPPAPPARRAGGGALAEMAPGWPRWLNVVALSDPVIAAARDLGCAGVSAEWHAVTPASARLCRRAALHLAAFTGPPPPPPPRAPRARRGGGAVCVEAAALDG